MSRRTTTRATDRPLRLVRPRTAAAWAVAAALIASAPPGPGAAVPGASPESAASLVGRRLVVGMEGTAPGADLLRRVRAGEVAGVILMGANVRSAPQVRALTTRLRAAARAGGHGILIATDQEGGEVRRFRWAPPAASAAALGRLGEAAVRARGRQTARALERLGVDVDLAPVADVPLAGSFLDRQERGFSRIPARVGKAATAFAAGLLDGGIAPTLKHFPGLGSATVSTDDAAVAIPGPPAAIAPALVPYRRALAAGVVPLVMISNASYAAYGGVPAVWSPRVLGLLTGLGFAGATITDALDPLAVTHGVDVPTAAVRAARAGVDLLLVVGSEATSRAAYAALLVEARAGRLSRASLEASAARVDELVATYAG